MRRLCVLAVAIALVGCVMPCTVRSAVSGVATVAADKAVYKPGDTVRLAYQFTSTSAESLDLTFTSSQRYDFTIRGGALFFRWSKGRLFADVMGYESIGAGETLTFASLWHIPPGTNAGQYTVAFSLKQSDPAFAATTTFRIGDSDASQPPSFPDVAASFARQSIDRLFGLGLVTGYRDGLFRPAGLITRAEGAVLSARARQLAAGGKTVSPWPDLTSRHWAYPMTMALLEEGGGVALSWAMGLFEPSKPITRLQFIMCLLAPAEGVLSAESSFADVPIDAPGGWEVAVAYQQGLVMGTVVGDATVFEPDRSITRAEAAVIIDRFLTAGVIGD